jgi:glycine cleavage system H protein
MSDRDPSDFQFPETLKYGPEHEWSHIGESGIITMGITDFAQDSLGEVQFLDVPQVGTSVEQGKAIAEVESVKTSSDVYAPCSGQVIEVNEELVQHPERINSQPYESWFVRIRASDTGELSKLLDAAGYTRRVTSGQGQ